MEENKTGESKNYICWALARLIHVSIHNDFDDQSINKIVDHLDDTINHSDNAFCFCGKEFAKDIKKIVENKNAFKLWTILNRRNLTRAYRNWEAMFPAAEASGAVRKEI